MVFLVSFTIFTTFNYFFPSDLTFSQMEFFNQNFNNYRKVILIGSSHVGQLNATHIEEIIIKKNPDFKIYNLAVFGDTPERRIKSLDKTLSLKPTLVLYGISYREFESSINSAPLLDTKQYFHDLFVGDQDDFGINNPKLTTLEFIRDISRKLELASSSNELTFQNTPFISYDTTIHFKIANNKELELQGDISDATKIHLERHFSPNDKQTASLIKMINNLKRNDINVILFTTPIHKNYFDKLPESEKQTFDEILERVKKETGVKIYNLTNNYSDLSIWLNITHISSNKNATIYSEDIAKIILDEIR